MNAERLRLVDQLEQVERDLVELDDQLDAGELDAETHARLVASYRAEADQLRRLIAEAPDEAESAVAAVPARSRKRVLVGAAILVAGVVVVSFLGVRSLQDRPSNALNGVVGDVARSGGVDLDQVSNEEMEAVIADNPDIVGMRMALARRYFEEGTFDKALDHYMVVLEQEPNAEALANVGWMTFLSGRPDVAVTFEEQAIALDPGYTPAYWFLANVRMYGLDDPEGAVEPLRTLLSADGVPDDIRAQASEMLASGGGG